MEYDARGNRTAVVDALSNRTTFTYNTMNRLTRIDLLPSFRTSVSMISDEGKGKGLVIPSYADLVPRAGGPQLPVVHMVRTTRNCALPLSIRA